MKGLLIATLLAALVAVALTKSLSASDEDVVDLDASVDEVGLDGSKVKKGGRNQDKEVATGNEKKNRKKTKPSKEKPAKETDTNVDAKEAKGKKGRGKSDKAEKPQKPERGSKNKPEKAEKSRGQKKGNKQLQGSSDAGY